MRTTLCACRDGHTARPLLPHPRCSQHGDRPMSAHRRPRSGSPGTADQPTHGPPTHAIPRWADDKSSEQCRFRDEDTWPVLCGSAGNAAALCAQTLSHCDTAESMPPFLRPEGERDPRSAILRQRRRPSASRPIGSRLGSTLALLAWRVCGSGRCRRPCKGPLAPGSPLCPPRVYFWHAGPPCPMTNVSTLDKRSAERDCQPR